MLSASRLVWRPISSASLSSELLTQYTSGTADASDAAQKTRTHVQRRYCLAAHGSSHQSDDDLRRADFRGTTYARSPEGDTGRPVPALQALPPASGAIRDGRLLAGRSRIQPRHPCAPRQAARPRREIRARDAGERPDGDTARALEAAVANSGRRRVGCW